MKFDDWVMSVPGSVKDLEPGPDGVFHNIPLITEVFYNCCGGDVVKMKEVMELMRLAFAAGAQSVSQGLPDYPSSQR